MSNLVWIAYFIPILTNLHITTRSSHFCFIFWFKLDISESNKHCVCKLAYSILYYKSLISSTCAQKVKKLIGKSPNIKRQSSWEPPAIYIYIHQRGCKLTKFSKQFTDFSFNWEISGWIYLDKILGTQLISSNFIKKYNILFARYENQKFQRQKNAQTQTYNVVEPPFWVW